MKLLTFVPFFLHYVPVPVFCWISPKSPMQHIQHATTLTSSIMDEDIVIGNHQRMCEGGTVALRRCRFYFRSNSKLMIATTIISLGWVVFADR